MKKCSRCRKGEDKVTFSKGRNRCDKCSSGNKKDNERMSNRHKVYYPTYPTSNSNIVYEFYYDDGTSAYVGETKNGSFRIWEHYCSKHKSFCKYLTTEERKAIFNYRELWAGNNDMKRKMMETHYIRKNQPEFNTIYK